MVFGPAPALASRAEAPGPAPSLRPPVATLRIVPVAANPKDPHAITATLPGTTATAAAAGPVRG